MAILAAGNAQAISPPGASQQQTLEAVSRDLKLEATDQLARTLQVLPPFSSLPTKARLRVVSVKPAFSPAMWLLRLECTPRSSCLPFYAALRYPGLDLSSLPRFAVRGLSQPAENASRQRAAHDPLARSGEQVEIVEQLAGVRLKAKAVCLQSGGLGDRIRVRNVSTNRILLATVTGEHLVRIDR